MYSRHSLSIRTEQNIAHTRLPEYDDMISEAQMFRSRQKTENTQTNNFFLSLHRTKTQREG